MTSRRQFISLLGSAAAAWPLAAHAQQPELIRHVGVLIGSSDHAAAQLRVATFLEAFKRLGWIEGRNVRIDLRWGDNPNRILTHARELVHLKPDVIFAGPTNAVRPLQRETRTIPIVFATVTDPLGQGIVTSMSRPTENVTGFSNLEFSMIGKWMQILKEADPRITRTGLMISTTNASSAQWYRTFSTVAPALAIEPISAPISTPADIEEIVRSIARRPSGALIVPGDTLVGAPPVRRLIIELTATHRLPTLYGFSSFASEGGLISYGIDTLDPYRRAASYVDRILKGEGPGDLPVQAPTKFQLLINLKAAKALGLQLSPRLVATADEVIE